MGAGRKSARKSKQQDPTKPILRKDARGSPYWVYPPGHKFSHGVPIIRIPTLKPVEKDPPVAPAPESSVEQPPAPLALEDSGELPLVALALDSSGEQPPVHLAIEAPGGEWQLVQSSVDQSQRAKVVQRGHRIRGKRALTAGELVVDALVQTTRITGWNALLVSCEWFCLWP